MAYKRKYPREYAIWKGMRMRCHNPNISNYDIYGGRGIKICDRWNNFTNFISDMGKSPEGSSIDRIDNDGNYEPGNCRWATRKEQANNRRSNRVIVFNGMAKTLTEWAEYVDIKPSTVRQRYYVHKWSFSDCLRPLHIRGHHEL